MEMKWYRVNRIKAWLPLLLLGLIMGCGSGKYFEAPQSGEIPNGPGLFTKGDDGAVVYDSKGGGLIDPHKEKAPEKPAASTGQVTAADQPNPIDDFEDFEAFKQWQEWKKGSEGTAEYKDFKDWQQWKRYQEWKQRQ